MANAFFRRQLASYASVHRDPRNKATHFIGIPLIIFSLLLPTSLWQVELGGRAMAASAILAILGVLGWLLLDLGIGVAMIVIMALMWYAAVAMAGALGAASTWVAFAVLFVGGWALQFLGHHYEGKRPALLDNLFQAFVGPMFLVAEVMVEAGWRHDLATAVSEGDVSTL
jgi:uncharacterized membrane protein YGL010W